MVDTLDVSHQVFPQGTDVNLPLCNDTWEVQMSDQKGVKLVVTRSLMIALWLIAGGLIANRLPINP